jgi:hypothetical protein
MIRMAATTVIACTMLLAQSPGIRPRAGVSDYPAHESTASAAFGAAVIPGGEVKKIFAADVDKAGYVVVEVGVFPAAGRDVDLSPADFNLRADPNALSERTADADAIAAAVIKPSPSAGPEIPGTDISVSGGASVAHTSYPDPSTGRRTGITTVGIDTGVGIGNRGAQYPSSSTGDTHRLEQQLWEKSLPDGRTGAPVAGYVYFPKPSKKAKGAAWVLEWQNAGERVNITLPK